jgi:hypothetical protein
MRRLTWAALAAGLLLLTPTGSAQIIDPPGFGVAITAQGTACTTAGACALIPLSTMPSVTIQIVGTFSATLQFEGTSDGQTWGAVLALKLSDGTTASSTTTTGQYTISNTGLQQVRVRCSSFVSGVASITGVRGYAMSGGRSPFFTTLYTDTLTFDRTNQDTSISRSAAGKITVTGTTPMIQLGGTTNSFPAIKSNGTTLQVRLADDSAFTAVDAKNFNIGVGAGQFQLSLGMFIQNTPPSAPASCGSSPAVTSNNGSAVWVITGGTGGVATGCSVTMPTAATGWNCAITNITQTAAHRADRTTVQTASTTTSVTWEYQTVSTGAATVFTASDVFRGICFAY